MSERKEALMRILVMIISGVIIGLWKVVVQVVVIVHWFVVIFTGRRNKSLADFSHVWNSQVYSFLKYFTFATNKRPFPFGGLSRVDNPDYK